MDLKTQYSGLDELLAVIYGNDVNLSLLLRQVGFEQHQIYQLQNGHLESIVKQLLEVIHKRLTSDSGKDTSKASAYTNGPTTAATTSTATADGEGQVVAQIVRLVNDARASAGCRPVTLEERLTEAAQDYTDVMARSGVLSHTGPDGSTMAGRVEATFPGDNGRIFYAATDVGGSPFAHSMIAVRQPNGTITYIDLQKNPPATYDALHPSIQSVDVIPTDVDWRFNRELSKVIQDSPPSDRQTGWPK